MYVCVCVCVCVCACVRACVRVRVLRVIGLVCSKKLYQWRLNPASEYCVSSGCSLGTCAVICVATPADMSVACRFLRPVMTC